MKKVKALLTTTAIVCLCVVMQIVVAYANTSEYEDKQELTKSDYGVLQHIRVHSIEGVLFFNEDNIQKLTVYKPIEESGYKEYKICNGTTIVAEIAAFRIENDPEWKYSARTEFGSISEYENYIELCEYDYVNHVIIGENVRSSGTTDLNLVLNSLRPLVQVDKNQIGRDWCFLSTMGMIINFFEDTEYTTRDIAEMYLNKDEVTGGELNSSGYISNSANYNGNSIKNIVFALQYRGIEKYSTQGLSYKRAKECIDRNGTAVLFFKRVYRNINEDRTVKEEKYEIGSEYDKVLGRHSVALYGYNKATNNIIVADPSPRENAPGQYTPDVVELWFQNGKYYIPPRGTDILNGKEVYKIYTLEGEYFYDKNKLDTAKSVPIEGSMTKQLSAYACMASIINKTEGLDKTAELIARNLFT